MLHVTLLPFFACRANTHQDCELPSRAPRASISHGATLAQRSGSIQGFKAPTTEGPPVRFRAYSSFM